MRGGGAGAGFGPGEWLWGWRGGPRRRRRRRVWFEAGEMKYVILSLLKDKPMHGYEVMKALEEQTQGCYKPSPGTVYPTLQWLEDEGLVEGGEANGKKVYSVTEEGLKFLEENKSTIEDIFDRVEEMIDSILSDPMPEITRLIARLGSQAYRQAWRMRDDREKRKRIKQVLEQAVKELQELAA